MACRHPTGETRASSSVLATTRSESGLNNIGVVMKLAMGLLHFNPHWNLDLRSAHRHCTEALVPLLRTLRGRPDWTLSIEMSGSGLEFVGEEYPNALGMLRGLINDGQVELISSLYTPNLWVAFPERDLRRSIDLNRKCLNKLKLPTSKVFFAQEGLFGHGIERLRDYFEVVVCKDDYLSYFVDLNLHSRLFTLGGMKVVVASGHILNELRRLACDMPEMIADRELPDRYVSHIQEATALNDERSFPCRQGCQHDLQWLWYHCGDGNHFGTPYKPDDLDACYFDHGWADLCASIPDFYRRDGYTMATVEQFAGALDYFDAQELPMLPEGSWNARQSGGVLCWMGRNGSPWEDDDAILSSLSRARARVVAAEVALSTCDRDRGESPALKLDEAWRHLLHGQISDALGWSAGPQAAQTALWSAHQAFTGANQVLDELTECVDLDPLLRRLPALDGATGASTLRNWPEPVIFGGNGTCAYTARGSRIRIVECTFRATAEHCGVGFPFEGEELTYCPSGSECFPVSIPLSSLKPLSIAVPLANGMLQIAPGLFVVKDLGTVHVAAEVRRREARVNFAAYCVKEGKLHRWRFHLVVGGVTEAVEYANTLNWM